MGVDLIRELLIRELPHITSIFSLREVKQMLHVVIYIYIIYFHTQIVILHP